MATEPPTQLDPSDPPNPENDASPGTKRGLRSSSMRQQNLGMLVSLLHREGPMSRSALGKYSGLTRASIGDLVQDLVAMELAVEGQAESAGRPGRPSTVVHPLSERNVVVGIDLMVESVRIAAIGLGGHIVNFRSRMLKNDADSPDKYLTEAIKLAEQAVAGAGATTRCFGVGIAVPGLVAQPSQSLVLAPNLGWRNVDVAGIVRDHLGSHMAIAVGNEANLGAIGESRRGATRHQRNTLYVSGEAGVGSGILVDGDLLTGAGGFAGEIGHIPVNPLGEQCGCGARGCFEAELGEDALLRRVRAAGTEVDSVDDIVQQAESGDKPTLEAICEHGGWLAVGLRAPINLLDPGAVVLGGLLGRLLPFFAEQLNAELEATALLAQGATPILAATLGDKAVVIGASELIWDQVFVDVRTHVEEASQAD